MPVPYDQLRPLTLALIGYPPPELSDAAVVQGAEDGALPHLWTVVRHIADKQFDTAQDHFDRHLSRFDASGDQPMDILLALAQARIHAGLGRHTEAIGLLNALQTDMRSANDHLQMAVHFRLGVLYRRVGALDDAAVALQYGLEIAERQGWAMDEASLLADLASVQLESGDPVQALATYERAAVQCDRIGDTSLTDPILINVATAYTRLGRHEDAAQLFESLLQRTDPPLAPRRRVSAMLNLAVVQKRLQQFDAAEEIYAQVVRITDADADDADRNRALIGMAEIASRKGASQRALDLLEEARQIALELSMPHNASEIEGMQADVLWDMGRRNEAIDVLHQAFESMQTSSFTRVTLHLGQMLVEKLEEAGHIDRAFAVLKQCQTLKETIYARESERALELSRVRTTVEAERAAFQQREADRRRLMNNVLPSHITDRLLGGEVRIAERLDHVAVMFADIVGFTSFAAERAPDDVVDDLEQFFQAIDHIVHRNGCEKIKTIGDAYMATNTTLKDHDPDGIQRLVRCALDMIDLAQQPALAHLTLRIGLHAGPAVTGVMSGMRLAYDMWGDTVNIASRMESTALPGTIQVTQVIAEALAPLPEFAVTERTLLDVRGRGQVLTYWVARANPTS